MENKKNNIIRIYGLVDPITNEVRYVGKTRNTLKKRLSQHLRDNKKNNPYKLNWISELKKQNLSPNIIELDICDETNWMEKEKHWINEFENLTNIAHCGESGAFFPQEILDKISISSKNTWKNEDYKENQSLKMKKYWSNPENKKRLSTFMLGKNFSNPQVTSDRLKELWQDEDYIDKMSTQSKKLWEDEEYKEKVLGYLQSEEHKLKTSERFKGKKLTEEHKKKIKESKKNNVMVSVDGVVYNSITEASELIPMNRDKLKSRLKSKNFTNYFKIENNGDN